MRGGEHGINGIVRLENQAAKHESNNEPSSIEWILECAVAVSWADLLPSKKSGFIHVNYRFSASGAIDSLSLWLSTVRGHWQLACEYRMSASKDRKSGPYFEQGYESAALARNFELIMRHQDAFLPVPNHGRDGLLQVCAPTQPELDTAEAAISAAHLEVDPATARMTA